MYSFDLCDSLVIINDMTYNGRLGFFQLTGAHGRVSWRCYNSKLTHLILEIYIESIHLFYLVKVTVKYIQMNLKYCWWRRTGPLESLPSPRSALIFGFSQGPVSSWKPPQFSHIQPLPQQTGGGRNVPVHLSKQRRGPSDGKRRTKAGHVILVNSPECR